MRSALICVFFALIVLIQKLQKHVLDCVAKYSDDRSVQKEGSRAEDVDFQPTPIPLNDWAGGKRYPAGTLQEFFKTDAPPTVAALPAHYWEDALRHSVYLSLVRDKIDQLIAKGSIISPDSQPHNLSKEVDDHDLWEKIKTAPFDRVKEDPLLPGDVIILARGKLIEDKEGYRFAEDDAISDKCRNDNCTQAVKAYWSVKRVRQTEKTPGKYHYELTFSVSSQPPKKVKEPYENPIRTFTIRENPPKEPPPSQIPRHPGHQQHTTRAQRAVWFHANIPHYQKRQVKKHTLERIFSSLFSDEDNYDEVPTRYKPNSHIQPHKFGENSYTQQKVVPSYHRYTRPPLQAPPIYNQRPYMNLDAGGFNQYNPFHQDHPYLRPNSLKSNKQVVLPTPVMNYQLLKESSDDVLFRTTLNATQYTTKEPEILTTSYKAHNHYVPPTKANYFPENIRTPIYNAPPGVFVTMDKKPFKPMPPLRLSHSQKPQKTAPFDFKPSPQILDDSHSDTDFLTDSAFRPITLNVTDVINSKKGSKNHQKKPLKKHDHVKYQRLTTVSPDIITGRTNLSEEQETMHWVEILGSFSKTTPMATQNDKEKIAENSLNSSTDYPTTSTELLEDETTITTGSTTSTSTTTTTTSTPPKTKRTRPPPKFKRAEKIKKHKRVVTTTTTTVKPPRQTLIKPYDDLMPQASSALTNGSSFVWETNQNGVSNSSTSATTTTTTNITSTTSRTTTTRVPILSTMNIVTEDHDTSSSTIQPRSKNRFRISTLMQKGTSVKHDKWSASTFEKNKTQSHTTHTFLRRKASKFQGYVPSSTPRLQDNGRKKEDHEDYGFSSNRTNINSMAYDNEGFIVTPIPPKPEGSNWKNDYDMNDLLDFNEQDKENTEEEIKMEDEDKQATLITEEIVPPGKNHTKCKKKKQANLTTTEISSTSSEVETSTAIVSTATNLISDALSTQGLFSESTKPNASSTERSRDIFEEILNEFTLSDDWDKSRTSSVQVTTSATTRIESEDYSEDFMHSNFKIDNATSYAEEEEDDVSVVKISDNKRETDDYYYDELESHADDRELRPLNLLDIMDMD